MGRENNRMGITFRINTDNEREKKLYEHLMDKEHGAYSMSAYIKFILMDYFENDEKEKILSDSFLELQECQKKAFDEIKNIIHEEIQQHDIKVLAALASNTGSYEKMSSDGVNLKEGGMTLPSESKELPVGMNHVLDMFDK